MRKDTNFTNETSRKFKKVEPNSAKLQCHLQNNKRQSSLPRTNDKEEKESALFHNENDRRKVRPPTLLRGFRKW